METLKGKQVPIKLWARIDEVESAALTQLKNIAALPWCFTTSRSCRTCTSARARPSARSSP